MPAFNLENFWLFCSNLRVDTKDRGQIALSPANLYGCQLYFIEEVVRGFNEGIHSFVVLKGRQLGITTICLVLDLYWLFRFSGMHGSLVTHDEESRDMFKATLSMYISSLPARFKIPILNHNRTQLIAKNRSRFSYQVAGKRKNSGLGKGKGLTFLHSTETSAYGDEEGLASLRASLAEEHPNRLFIYESTAQGFNHFEAMWDSAQDSTSERAIFIGWWRKESYSKAADTPQFKVYGEERLTGDERKWVREVEQEYGHKITREQMAWWRWKLNEDMNGDIDHMMQNFPPTAKYAFIASGSNFFSTSRLTDEIRVARKYPNNTYRFVLKEHFEESDIVQCAPKAANLTIWEYPKPNAMYSIGADPTFGSSEWADRHCASVWRCYGDGMDQVAEFNDADGAPYQFAWVILYLAGAYTTVSQDGNGRALMNSVMLNLEINGPGQSVWTEMQNMRRFAAMQPKSDVSKKIMLVTNNLQNYLYKRIDTFGKPTAYHWKSTFDTKERMLNFFKDCFERGSSIVRSPKLIDEMGHVVRDDGQIGAPNRGKDDRVIAAGLAHVAWSDSIRVQCIQRGLLRPKRAGEDAPAKDASAIGTSMMGYLKRLGIKVAA